MRFTLILSLLLSVLAVVFALQNPEEMRVELGPFEITGSTALVLIITFVIGVCVGALAMVPSRLRSRKKMKALQKQTREHDASISEFEDSPYSASTTTRP